MLRDAIASKEYMEKAVHQKLLCTVSLQIDEDQSFIPPSLMSGVGQTANYKASPHHPNYQKLKPH